MLRPTALLIAVMLTRAPSSLVCARSCSALPLAVSGSECHGHTPPPTERSVTAIPRGCDEPTVVVAFLLETAPSSLNVWAVSTAVVDPPLEFRLAGSTESYALHWGQLARHPDRTLTVILRI